MKTLNFILVTLLSIFLFSCLGDDQPTKVKPIIQDSIEVVTDTMSIDFGWCFDYTSLRDKKYYTFVIRDSSEFNIILEAKFENPPCDTIFFPRVDFSRYTLIGRYIYCSGPKTNSKFEKTLYKKRDEKKYIYFMKLEENYKTMGVWFSFNWLLIPKLEDGWAVEFDSTYTLVNP